MKEIISDIFGKIAGLLKSAYKFADKFAFKINDSIVYFIAMFMFSFTIIALEVIYLHMLLIVSNYIKATFIIAIAMLGITTGSFLSFFLLKVKTKFVLLVSSIVFFVSIIFSYYNIINIGDIKYPFFLILPFVSGTVIVSSIFAHEHSNVSYFVNLIGSACGTLFPIIFIRLVKSENSLLILMFVPLVFMFIQSFNFKNLFFRVSVKAVSIIAFLLLLSALRSNLALPEKIPVADMENKIMPILKSPENYINMPYDVKFISRVYTKNEATGMYDLSADEYDKKRAKYLLSDIGYNEKYQFSDKDKLKGIKEKLFSLIGSNKTLDLNIDVKPHRYMRDLWKIYANEQRVMLSEDSLFGRVELLGDDEYMNLAIDGVILDGIDSYNGAGYDPRVPHIDNANVFIIGLSADGIVKSAKRLPNVKKVSGIEINPIVRKIMAEGSKYAEFAHNPYKDVNVYYGEGRSYLESTSETYDMITLMNIHMEHGPICTLSPEYFHTTDGTKMLLNKLTDRGMVVYEEIIMNDRSRYSFYKFLNTAVDAMKKMGIEDPKKCIYVFEWDFWGSGNAFRTVVIKRTPYTKEEISRFDNYLEICKKSYPSLKTDIHPALTYNNDLENIVFNNDKPDRYTLTHIPSFLEDYVMDKDIIKKLKKNESDKEFVKSVYAFNQKSGIYYLKKIDKDQKKKLEAVFEKAGYPYIIDISPINDNKPFPFNIYKNKKEVSDLFYLILIITSILFAPILLILIIKIGKYKFDQFVQILFFAVIGFGFMLVEIVLMQKYQRFIGNPTFSFIITLGGILFFSGIGSFVSKFLPKKILYVCLIMIPVILLLKLFFLDSLFLLFGKFGFGAKVFISCLMLFPLTFLMGMPFPNMLEAVKKRTTNEYGTLMYGVSGAFSSIASTSAILMSVTYGFGSTFIFGSIAYLAGIMMFFLIVLRLQKA